MAWLVPIILSLSTTILFMLAFRPMAVATGLVDKPGGRKAHTGDIPVIGGLAMFIGLVVGLAMLPDKQPQFVHLPIAGGLLVVIGLIDDRFGLPTATRLLAQISAVLIMVYGGGLIMRDIGDPLWIGVIGLGPLALVLTGMFTMTVVNSFNLIDGIDGLSGSVALIALLAIVIVSKAAVLVATIASIVIACILGFLIFNVPMTVNRRVRSFMGDSGSTMLGMIIVWLTISICQGENRIISPVIALWFVALPMFDLLTCVVRRAARRKSPFASGQDHIHHTLRRGGFDDAEILIMLTSIAAFYAAIGVAGHLADVGDSLMFTLWSVAGLVQYTIVKRACTIRRAAIWRRMMQV